MRYLVIEISIIRKKSEFLEELVGRTAILKFWHIVLGSFVLSESAGVWVWIWIAKCCFFTLVCVPDLSEELQLGWRTCSRLFA
ncbi:MAG: hypothetical protein RBG13Loki_3122 [Promethearchaeota archaeon CR_4]|nr:MAG: hypothetical protein RBG13Loki_3122 [Candidatus Lokiarchaeota archaeon CR_4]